MSTKLEIIVVIEYQPQNFIELDSKLLAIGSLTDYFICTQRMYLTKFIKRYRNTHSKGYSRVPSKINYFILFSNIVPYYTDNNLALTTHFGKDYV